MKVGVIGGGAIGLLVASYLHEQYDVTIYTRRQEQADLLNRQKLRLIKHGNEQNIPVRAIPFGWERVEADLLFITVKQYDLAHVIEQWNEWSETATLIFLQNGMGHIRLLSQLKQRNVVIGVVEHGALKRDDRTVEHTGIGKITLSLFQGQFGRLKRLLNASIPDFPIGYEEDWYGMLTKKLVVNALVNPLTAVLRVRNGELLNVHEYKEMMRLLFTEVCAALALSNGEEAWEHIVRICEKTANNRSSMLSDLEQGRKTEIEAILGYVMEKGNERNIPTPLCQFLFHAVKGMEGRDWNE
ncbi:2-dehydropantoate 2-reductase [Anoxybacillus tepidamans]|uniref:2-dehydropantoate 2-reductase n=1 Tax=Anoxybacteroides tepidamans TaxID=265948 RepID=A0A7W8MUD7_9BACL|nr:2-dehydropantoate 2-reductase [Anoxybacillus tepidamans]MBB5323788.1 2-dehydropantoate 2-reductase [Anoxybacillus tepidamans]